MSPTSDDLPCTTAPTLHSAPPPAVSTAPCTAACLSCSARCLRLPHLHRTLSPSLSSPAQHASLSCTVRRQRGRGTLLLLLLWNTTRSRERGKSPTTGRLTCSAYAGRPRAASPAPPMQAGHGPPLASPAPPMQATGGSRWTGCL
jgi:hypothetical protein